MRVRERVKRKATRMSKAEQDTRLQHTRRHAEDTALRTDIHDTQRVRIASCSAQMRLPMALL